MVDLGAEFPALIRTMRGLPERGGTGDADFFLVNGRIGRKGSSFCFESVFDFWFSLAIPKPLLFLDGEERSITEASSPRIAFASALNFIGGTGISSSELSPIENFHDLGSGPSLATCIAERGLCRLRSGRDGWWRIDARDGARRI